MIKALHITPKAPVSPLFAFYGRLRFRNTHRSASTTSAINRGIRKSRLEGPRERESRSDGTRSKWFKGDDEGGFKKGSRSFSKKGNLGRPLRAGVDFQSGRNFEREHKDRDFSFDERPFNADRTEFSRNQYGGSRQRGEEKPREKLRQSDGSKAEGRFLERPREDPFYDTKNFPATDRIFTSNRLDAFQKKHGERSRHGEERPWEKRSQLEDPSSDSARFRNQGRQFPSRERRLAVRLRNDVKVRSERWQDREEGRFDSKMSRTDRSDREREKSGGPQERTDFKDEGGRYIRQDSPSKLRNHWESGRDAPRQNKALDNKELTRGPRDHDGISDQDTTDIHTSWSPRREITTNTPRHGQFENEPTITYTTPASVFLYGSSVVTAALKSGRRKLYKLYMYSGLKQEPSLRKALLKHKVEIIKLESQRLLDRMSKGRPHNGLILEASPLPKRPITELCALQGPKNLFRVVLDHQTREDEAVNGIHTNVNRTQSFFRFPLVLLLDGILDTGNLGAIMRSAYFLGVDAVITTMHGAPITPVSLKAAVGAFESMTLLSVSKERSFLDQSRANGWKLYASDALPEGEDYTSYAPSPKSLTLSDLGTPLNDHPCILLLGGEESGVRKDLKKKADYVLSIESPKNGEGGVDSLNVSVAAGIMCEAFLRRPVESGVPRKSKSVDSSIQASTLDRQKNVAKASTKDSVPRVEEGAIEEGAVEEGSEEEKPLVANSVF